MEKLIITAALIGALTTREQNSNAPYSPKEIAGAAIDAWRAGASMVHLHVRNPNRCVVQDPEALRRSYSFDTKRV